MSKLKQGILVGAAGLALAAPAAQAQYGYGPPSGSSGSGSGAAAEQGQPAADVKAEGNPFSGGLAFDPPNVAVKVGEIVRWTNTDQAVPHTATENHGLWDLAGTYGNEAIAPTGFGPGESRQ